MICFVVAFPFFEKLNFTGRIRKRQTIPLLLLFVLLIRNRNKFLQSHQTRLLMYKCAAPRKVRRFPFQDGIRRNQQAERCYDSCGNTLKSVLGERSLVVVVVVMGWSGLIGRSLKERSFGWSRCNTPPMRGPSPPTWWSASAVFAPCSLTPRRVNSLMESLLADDD